MDVRKNIGNAGSRSELIRILHIDTILSNIFQLGQSLFS